MPAFRFRLATLLRLREATRDERRGQLAEALRIADGLAAQAADIDRELADCRRREATQAGPLNLDQLLDAHRYELVLLSQRRHLELQQATVGEEVDRRREALVAANRDVRALEKLREAQQERQRVAEALQVQKQFDEVAGRGMAGAAREVSEADHAL